VNQHEEFGWLVIQIKPREEKRAIENLSNQGFEYYFPVIYSLSKYRQNSQIKKEPMFPGYAFVRVSQNIDLKSLNSTRGVIKIIRFGDEYPLLIIRIFLPSKALKMIH
jgi:transcriptional antiterminator RfaH